MAFGIIEAHLHLHPDHVVASIDISAAHSSIRRDRIAEICADRAPRMGQILRRWYSAPTPKTWCGSSSHHDLDTRQGLGQGFPEAAPLFCIGQNVAVDATLAAHPSVRPVAFQDDTYLVGSGADVAAAMVTLAHHLAALDLKVNALKLQLYSPSAAAAAALPEHLHTHLVTSLKILGQRLRVRLSEEGLDYCLTADAGVRSARLQTAHDQMHHFGGRLRALTDAGLPEAVAHRLWVYATTGGIVHLQGVDYYTATEMRPFDVLQADHAAWMAKRDLTAKEAALASLPANSGGGGLACHTRAAVSNFLSTSARLSHTISQAMDWPSVEEYMTARPDLTQRREAATRAAREAGAPASSIPSPSSAGGCARVKKAAKRLTTAMQQQARQEIAGELDTHQYLRLQVQSRRGAGLFLQDVLPKGNAPANATWNTEWRQRLLLPGPGADAPPSGPALCQIRYVKSHNTCQQPLHAHAAHEHLCGVGGFRDIRHNQCRDWVKERLDESVGGRSLTEQPHPYTNRPGMGRMDIKHDSCFGHLDIDITIPSIYSDNPRETLRRHQQPNRAIRDAIREKQRKYGASVLAFAVDDLGVLSHPATELLRRLAQRDSGEHNYRATLQAWKAEIQHMVLAATAGMAQAARGQPRTS